MGWIAKYFGKRQTTKAASEKSANSRSAKTKSAAKPVTKSVRGSARKVKKSSAKEVAHPYRAVTVYSRSDCCEAAQRLAGQKFLAAHAPRLPLGGCTQAESCQCRYKHLQDRRVEMRRDTDHSLPARYYGDAERRSPRDRRRRQNDQQALAS